MDASSTGPPDLDGRVQGSDAVSGSTRHHASLVLRCALIYTLSCSPLANSRTRSPKEPPHAQVRHLSRIEGGAVAYFKDGRYLTRDSGAKFDLLHYPGQQTPFSGIYCCEICEQSVTSVTPHPLPPQNHHQHVPYAPIRWRLIVKAHFR